MEDYDDLSSYNGDTEHDMLVDYDYYINTQNSNKVEVYYEDEYEEDENEYEDEVNKALERIRNILSEVGIRFDVEQND